MYILADIGGTKMRFALSTDGKSIGESHIVDTPETYVHGLTSIIEAMRHIAGEHKISHAILGVAGVLAPDRLSMLSSEHLSAWAGHPLIHDLESVLGTSYPIMLENDTALVGLGEAVYGAGKGASIVAYMTVSTGVNGVRVVDGRLETLAFGFEIGGQYLAHETELVTLEDLISGSAVERIHGKHPRDLGKDNLLWENLARTTAIGVHNTILHWSPHRVVLGGSMFNDIGIPVESVKKYVQQILKKLPKAPEIVHSSLKDEGGLYGGLARLIQNTK
jgi:glucokinase